MSESNNNPESDVIGPEGLPPPPLTAETVDGTIYTTPELTMDMEANEGDARAQDAQEVREIKDRLGFRPVTPDVIVSAENLNLPPYEGDPKGELP